MKTIVSIFMFCCAGVFADVKPADIFSDGIVLQRDVPVRIWGMADAKEKVSVKFAGQETHTVADDSGKWIVTLAPMTVSAEDRVLLISGAKSKVSINNVLVGEVWLAGGQSNMATTMATYYKKTQVDIENANDPLLRMFTVPKIDYAGQEKPSAVWKISEPENVKDFSASAYYFALNLRQKLEVPVGVVTCAVGGTPVEAWMSRKTLSSTPEMKRIIDAYDQYVETSFKDEADYLAQLKQYKKDVTTWQENKKAKVKKNPKPIDVFGPRNYKRPCGLYENMLTQVIPYTVRGAIWYQGENNANNSNGLFYRTVFSELIKEWRSDFQNPDMPFYFVQLATLGRGTEPHWAELRDSQKWVSEHVPNTGMVVLLDGGEKTDIHPHSKHIVGERLSLLAMNKVYGKSDVVCLGPTLKEVKKEDSKLILTFDNARSGLVLKPGGENTFEVSGKDGQYLPAQAALFEGKIIVQSAEVKDPEYVRYGWNTWVVPTLYNRNGLPASPFKTDEMKAASEGRYYMDSLKKK